MELRVCQRCSQVADWVTKTARRAFQLDTGDDVRTTPATEEKAGRSAAGGNTPFAGIDHIVRLVLIGDPRVGKTCILRRYLNDYFDEEGEGDYSSTLGVDFGCKTVDLQDERIRLQVWDTGGVEAYAATVSHYLHGADGIALVYDVNDRGSFERLKRRWAPYVAEHAPPIAKVVLVGNKAEQPPLFRQVTTSEAQRFADALNVPAFEVSALDGTNVDLALLTLMRDVLSRPPLPPTPAAAAAAASDAATAADCSVAERVWQIALAGWKRVVLAWGDVFGSGAAEGASTESRSRGPSRQSGPGRRGGAIATAAAGAAATVLGRGKGGPQLPRYAPVLSGHLEDAGAGEEDERPGGGGGAGSAGNGSREVWWQLLHEMEAAAGGIVEEGDEEGESDWSESERYDDAVPTVLPRGSGVAADTFGAAADDNFAGAARASSTAQVAAGWLEEARQTRSRGSTGSGSGGGYSGGPASGEAGAADLLGIAIDVEKDAFGNDGGSLGSGFPEGEAPRVYYQQVSKNPASSSPTEGQAAALLPLSPMSPPKSKRSSLDHDSEVPLVTAPKSPMA